MFFDGKDFPAGKVVISGGEYPFHSDFREWMRFEDMITSPEVPEWAVTDIALKMIFPEEMPEDKKSAVGFIMHFYRCGAPEPKPRTPADGRDPRIGARRPFSYSHDWGYICAAFMELYKIDLTDIQYLHWWKFKAYFKSLHGCKFNDITGFRAADINDGMSDERREFLINMQEIYELPVSVNEKLEIERAIRFLEG